MSLIGDAAAWPVTTEADHLGLAEPPGVFVAVALLKTKTSKLLSVGAIGEAEAIGAVDALTGVVGVTRADTVPSTTRSMNRPPMSITAATGTDAATGVTTVGTTTTGVAGTTGAVGTTGTTGTAGIKPQIISKPSRAIKSHYANKYDLHFV